MNYEQDLFGLYESCVLCPRACKVNRRSGRTGFCGETFEMRIACACLHQGEEPPISGTNGSGTVFFTGCTLRCPFCQNSQISRDGLGRVVSVEELASVFLTLQEKGAANINLVTGTHFVPHIIRAAAISRALGLSIPFLWNSSGYEEVSTIELLRPIIDIWVPDIKTFDRKLALDLFGTDLYPEKAREAVQSMADGTGTVFENDLLLKGLIVRHLVLPGEYLSTREVLSWFKKNLSDRALLSLMCQYIPLIGSGKNRNDAARDNLRKKISEEEYDNAVFLLDELGIDDGFVQEQYDESNPDSGADWTPDFSRENPFPGKFASPVWHYTHQFLSHSGLT
jgi:putative pyruvate formate lyase activating enzyme